MRLFFLCSSAPSQSGVYGFFPQEVLINREIGSRNVGGHCETSFMNLSTLERLAAVDLTDSELLGALEDRFAERRAMDAEITRLAAQVSDRSCVTLGREGLATRLGENSPAAVLAAVGLITLSEARLFCRVGDATSASRSLTGEVVAPRHPLVAEAFCAGSMALDSANWIVSNLDQASPRADFEQARTAERLLCEFATENPADSVRRMALAWRDALDVDGIEPRDEWLTRTRSLRRRVLPNGMKLFSLTLAPVGAAYLDAYLDGYVGNVLRAPSFESGVSPGSDDAEPQDPRTLTQISADAFVELAQHGISCRSTAAPMPSTTIVVRMSLDSLLTGLGAAHIDGGDQPISAGAARRMAADAHIIPAVLGGPSEVLDLGRSNRLFSRAQRLALAERDGGCAVANCHKPPSFAEAHHIRWWTHDAGPTDLENGILLCSRHHHSIHQGGWDVMIRDGVPWFIPPSSVDVYRRPRRGGRAPVPEILPELVPELVPELAAM